MIPADPLGAFLAGLDERDREVLALLVAEEAEGRGVRDPSDSTAAVVVGPLLREIAERFAIEVEGERARDRADDEGIDLDDDLDDPAVPYADADLGALADAAVADAARLEAPALDAAIGRFVLRLGERQRRGLLRRARRAWRRAGVRDADDPASRPLVRRALLDEALQLGFSPPPVTVRERTHPLREPPAGIAEELARAGELPPAVMARASTASAEDVRAVIDQFRFVELRGALAPAIRERWLETALARLTGGGPRRSTYYSGH